MELVRHCELCDHQQIDFSKGSTCALTNHKPSFSRTCSKIVLNKKFEDRLERINVQYELVRRQKTLALVYLFAFLGISAIVFFIAYMIGKTTELAGAFSFVIIIIYGIGGLLFLMAFQPLGKYIREIEVAKSNKVTIDTVLEKYKISYDIDITVGKKIHGEQKYHSQINIMR